MSSTKLAAGEDRVSISFPDAMNSPNMGREIVLGDVVDSDHTHVQIEEGGSRVPALIALETVLTQRVGNEKLLKDFWEVRVTPDHPEVRTRLLFTRRAENAKEALDLNRSLRTAHRALSELDPPEGTKIQIVFGYEPNMTPFWDFYGDSLGKYRVAREAARRENKLIRARHSPLGLWVFEKVLRRNLFVPEPSVPQSDVWMNFHANRLDEIVKKYFLRSLHSLWKAAFMQGVAARQLGEKGYRLEKLHRTQLGAVNLAGVVAARRKMGVTIVGDMLSDSESSNH